MNGWDEEASRSQEGLALPQSNGKMSKCTSDEAVDD